MYQVFKRTIFNRFAELDSFAVQLYFYCFKINILYYFNEICVKLILPILCFKHLILY